MCVHKLLLNLCSETIPSHMGYWGTNLINQVQSKDLTHCTITPVTFDWNVIGTKIIHSKYKPWGLVSLLTSGQTADVVLMNVVCKSFLQMFPSDLYCFCSSDNEHITWFKTIIFCSLNLSYFWFGCYPSIISFYLMTFLVYSLILFVHTPKSSPPVFLFL